MTLDILCSARGSTLSAGVSLLVGASLTLALGWAHPVEAAPPRATGAADTPAKPAQSQSSAETPDSPGAIGKQVAAARDAAAKGRDSVVSESARIAELVAQRKAAMLAAATSRREFTKHSQAAGRAYKAYQLAAKKDASGEKATASLELARTEYAAAIEHGALLLKQTKELAAIDDAAAKSVTNATSSANAAKAAETEAVAALAKLKALSDETKKASLAANQQLIRLRAQSGVPSAASASTKKVASEKMLAALSAQLDAARQDLAQLPKQPTPPTRDAKAATVAGAQCGAELKFETASSAADRKLVAAAYADALTDSGNEVTIAKVDLNGDGILDGIISVRGQDWCGTAGCSMSVQVSRDGRFVRALDVTTEDLAVAKTNTGGFCDLILEGSVTWKWTGKSYEVKR